MISLMRTILGTVAIYLFLAHILTLSVDGTEAHADPHVRSKRQSKTMDQALQIQEQHERIVSLRPQPAWSDESVSPDIGRAQTHLRALQAKLEKDYKQLMGEQYSNRVFAPKTQEELSEGINRMQDAYKGLHEGHPDHIPWHLSEINLLRSHHYRLYSDFGHVRRFGDPWNYHDHGPYPAQMLSQETFNHHSGPKIRAEFMNARVAIHLQEELNKSQSTYRGLPAYTNDLELLKSALDYHVARLQDAREEELFIDGFKKIRL
ncbi:hypothetical protein BCV70DRAFT_79234 [Testicularia cyperi]|uniref:Uncharacterized protein n=1 Tax=Testicularia cyperi TaxID=1882483 RepID=A0A317XV45_9BASI|nr:hypothetical protein BCV70DRAFT_79234 [Testicularia cyperi]